MQYVSLEQRIATQEFRIQQLLSQAQRYAHYYSAANKNIIEYLIEEPQNHRIRRHTAILEAEEAYDNALHAAYKAAKAYEYHYNYYEDGYISNQVFTYRSIKELEEFTDILNDENQKKWNNPTLDNLDVKISVQFDKKVERF